MIPRSLRVLVASLGSSASTVRRSSVRSAPMPVSLSIALTGRSRKRFEAPAASAISLRPIAVSWSTFLPKSGLFEFEACELVDELARRAGRARSFRPPSRGRALPLRSAQRAEAPRADQVQLRLRRGFDCVSVSGAGSVAMAQILSLALVRRGAEPVNAARAFKCIIIVRHAKARSQARTWSTAINHRP